MKKIRILHNEGYGTYRIEWRSPWWPFWSTPWWATTFHSGGPMSYGTLEEAVEEARIRTKKDAPWVVVGVMSACEKCDSGLKVMR